MRAFSPPHCSRLPSGALRPDGTAVFVPAMRFALAIAALLIAAPALAGDPTGYWARESAAGRAPPKEWWQSLKSAANGLPCCDIADGEKVLDVDWDTMRDAKGAVHYRVRLLGKWWDVPDEAIVTDPNLYGPAVVWPVYADDGEGHHVNVNYIRCFLPGAGA